MEIPTYSSPDYWRQRWQRGETQWDKGRPHPALARWLQKHPPAPRTRVLIPGCGAGHDVRCWANAGAFAVGMDVAPEAVEAARAVLQADPIRHPEGACEFLTGSIFHPPGELHASFDIVFEHTCFCAFDPANRSDYARGVAAVLRPHGTYIAVFYMTPNHPEPPPFGSDAQELFSLYGTSFELVQREPVAESFAGREGAEEFWIWRKKP